MTKDEILDALRSVKYPPYSKDIVAFGMVKYLKVEGDCAEIRIYTGGEKTVAEKVAAEAANALKDKFPSGQFKVVLLSECRRPRPRRLRKTPKRSRMWGLK